MSGHPYSDDVLEHAARTLYEGPDQYGRPSSVTWMEMLTYGGEFPENTTHPIAENFRTMARGVLDAVHDREALGLDASVCARTQLDAIVALLQSDTAACFRDGKMLAGQTLQAFKARLLREFGDEP